MNTETLHEQLDAWAAGTLSEPEINTLRSWIKDHPEALQEMEERQLVSELMEFSIARDLRKQFNATEIPSSAPMITLKRIASIAAIGLFLIVAGALFYAYQGPWDHSELVAIAAKTVAIPTTGSVRGENAGTSANFRNEVMLIEDGQIDRAISTLMDSLAVHPQSLDHKYLIAYAAFRQEDYTVALAQFNLITPGEKFSFADDLRWNKILCKMHLKYATPEIQNDLAEIINDKTSDHRQEAKNLDEQLSSIWYWMANLFH